MVTKEKNPDIEEKKKQIKSSLEIFSSVLVKKDGIWSGEVSEEEKKRVEIIIYEQMRKYKYLFTREVNL